MSKFYSNFCNEYCSVRFRLIIILNTASTLVYPKKLRAMFWIKIKQCCFDFMFNSQPHFECNIFWQISAHFCRTMKTRQSLIVLIKSLTDPYFRNFFGYLPVCLHIIHICVLKIITKLSSLKIFRINHLKSVLWIGECRTLFYELFHKPKIDPFKNNNRECTLIPLFSLLPLKVLKSRFGMV